MKIDNTSKALGAYGAQSKPVRRESTPKTSDSASASASDNVAINPKIGAVEREVAAEPAFDAAKVDAIKQAIASGSFQINPDKIADRLIASAQDLLSR
ncbi:MAG TPA: flagellar biosynthesis anti-sigma factor FlgM [Pseudogulbenkiania sp.]|nr:flagellar biosynthesis anti-sigma factor FlgM [Pseudogulbenkiania sp.]